MSLKLFFNSQLESHFIYSFLLDCMSVLHFCETFSQSDPKAVYICLLVLVSYHKCILMYIKFDLADLGCFRNVCTSNHIYTPAISFKQQIRQQWTPNTKNNCEQFFMVTWKYDSEASQASFKLYVQSNFLV